MSEELAWGLMPILVMAAICVIAAPFVGIVLLVEWLA